VDGANWLDEQEDTSTKSMYMTALDYLDPMVWTTYATASETYTSSLSPEQLEVDATPSAGISSGIAPQSALYGSLNSSLYVWDSTMTTATGFASIMSGGGIGIEIDQSGSSSSQDLLGKLSWVTTSALSEVVRAQAIAKDTTGKNHELQVVLTLLDPSGSDTSTITTTLSASSFT